VVCGRGGVKLRKFVFVDWPAAATFAPFSLSPPGWVEEQGPSGVL